MSKRAYIAFGSNIGDAEDNILSAAEALKRVPGIIQVKMSELMRTKPWGYENQPDFINSCAKVETELSPEALLGVCLGIEAGMGRMRKIKNGPRIIDIDLILYEDETRNTEELKLPHPLYKERDFVLVPLIEVADASIKEELKKDLIKLKERYVY